MKNIKPKDRVNRIIDHKEADRVPLDIWAEEEVKEKLIKYFGFSEWEQVLRLFNIDIRWPIPWLDYLPVKYSIDKKFYIDSWGFERWVGNEVVRNHPLANIESIDDVDKFNFPDPNKFNYDNYAKECEKYSDYFVCGGSWSCFFNTANHLVGMENLLVKMIDIPEVILYLFEKITDFYLEVSKKMFEKANKWIDIFFMGDDFGTQQSLLISKPMFQYFMKPNLERLFKQAKNYGKKVMLHSDGNIYDIIPDLIEIGLDVLNPIQPRIEDMDIFKLKKEFGKKISFHGGIDSQNILPLGSENDVKNEVIKKIAGVAPGGGFILSSSHNIQNDVPIENIITMYNTAYNYGFYGYLGKLRK